MQATLQAVHDSSQEVRLKFSMVPKLKHSQSPNQKENIISHPSLKELKLADPDLSGALDLIICSINRCKCITKDFNYFPKSKLATTKTIFGWTIINPLDSKAVRQMQPKEDPLQRSLEHLWE